MLGTAWLLRRVANVRPDPKALILFRVIGKRKTEDGTSWNPSPRLPGLQALLE